MEGMRDLVVIIKTKSKYYGIACVLLFAIAPIKNSLATGSIRVESNGFMRRSEDRADSSSTIAAGPDIDSQGKIVEGKLDLEAIVQVSDTKKLVVDRNAFTVEAANAYFATSKQLAPHHQISIGRRLYDLARFDDEWQFGTYSPRFIWDKFRPETIGLTGFFYTYDSKHWRGLAYASPINIPERGYPMRNQDGHLTSTNPFAPVYPDSAVVAKKNLPINYTIDYPPMSTLVTNPAGMLSARYSTEEHGKGIWAQSLYSYSPINQPNLAIEPYTKSPFDHIDVVIHPSIQNHHMMSFETGIEKSKYALWSSVTKEIPTSRDIPSSWVGMSAEPAMIYAAGGNVTVWNRLNLNASYIFVDEKISPAVENQNFTVDLGSRFEYHRAAKAALSFYGSERITYTLGFVADLMNESQFASFDITYRIVRKDNALTLNLGSDFFASATGKGYIGTAQGNDRFRGGISYAF
jgi:hypothetical protein